MKKPIINMIYLEKEAPGQGVGSATREQIELVEASCHDLFEVHRNDPSDGDINHYHHIDPLFYMRLKRSPAINVMHVHFLAETMEGSINLPKPAFEAFKMYFLDFYRSNDYLVVVNPNFIKPLTRIGIPPDRIRYIPNYVSKDRFYPLTPSRIEAIKTHYKIPLDKFVVLGVGQVQTRKGVQDFLEVARMNPDICFVWAGGFSFGAITSGYQELQRAVDHAPDNCYFLGIIPREQMNDIYNLCDLLFMPSYNELFPMAILESANVTKPLLLRDLDLYQDILFNKYLRANDNQGFSNLIKQLAKKEDLYQKAQGYALEIATYYSKEAVGAQWKDFYQNILQDHQNTYTFFVNEQDYQKISQKILVTKIESSLWEKPLAYLSLGTSLIFKKLASFSQNKLFAQVVEIHSYDKKTDDFKTILAKLKEQGQVTDFDEKVHQLSNYLTVVHFELSYIYQEQEMIDVSEDDLP